MVDNFSLNLKLSEKQALAFSYLVDDITKEIGYWWGAGWGKSYLWVVWIWMMTQKYPWTRRFFGRRELVNLIRTTLNTYWKFLDDYSIPKNLRWKFDKKYNIIKFLNGSEILLLDLATNPSDPLFSRFWSLELTGGFADEGNEADEQAITILKTRIWRQKNREYNLVPKFFITFNPDQWFCKRNFYTPYKEWNLPLYRKFIPALVTDNPYIDPAYIQQLQNSDEITRQRLLLGNFDRSNDTWKVFRYDEITDLFRSNIEKNDITYISADIARMWDDKTVIWLRRWLDCFKIITYKQNTVDEIITRIKELEEEYQVQRNHIVIDSDGVWWGVADGLRGCINFVNNTTPFKFEIERKGFVKKNYGNLKTQCYFFLKNLLEKRLMRVESDWIIKDELSAELENIYIKWNENDAKIYIESKESIKKRLWRSPDYADMIMMRCIRLVNEQEERHSSYQGVEEVDYSDLLY